MIALAALVLVAAAATGADGGAPSIHAIMNANGKTLSAAAGACFNKASLKKPWLDGRLLVNVTIEGSGAVGAVQIVRTELDDVALLACTQDAVRALKLVRTDSAGPVAIPYTFVFVGGRGGDPAVLVDGRPMPAVLPQRCTLPAQCRQLGVGLARGDDHDRARAFEFFQSGCKLNDGVSCAGAAAALDAGRGVAKDVPGALALYERACALRSLSSCTAVAMTHALGLMGVAKDEGLGEQLLERACAAGDGAACLDVAERLRFGVGVARDEARAAEIRRAALARD
jgi:TPR repeat protein